MDYQYQFKHISTGRLIIAQSWREFYDLQDNKEYKEVYTFLGRLELYGKHDVKSIHQRNRMNKFWEGARGFEKADKVKCSGIPCSGMYNYIRNFLVNVHNHACMQGDTETIKKANKQDVWFYHNSNVSRLLLKA